MYKKMKYKLLILCSFICVYIFFHNNLYAMSQKEAGEAIATFALNFQKAPDGGQTWTYDWDSYARSQAYHGKKMSDGTYHADCVGWVSMCLHQSIGLDAPNVSDGSCGFVVPTIYSQNYSGFGSVIVDVTGQQLMPGDILQNSHHVMIYVGNIGGEDRIVHSVGSPLNNDSFSSYASWNESAGVDISGVYQHAYRISESHAATLDKSQVKTTWNGSSGDYSFGEGSTGSGSVDSGSSGGGLDNFGGNPNYQVQADDKKKNFRIVSINDKLPIYKHILLTEKYNFNKIKWKMYGHGNSEGKSSPTQSDITLGLKYPKDEKNTKLGKFVSLVLPYIQTWYIPLSMYSGILNAESGNMLFDSDDTDDSGGYSSSTGGPADYSGNDNVEKVWNFLKSKGMSDISAAAAMGNIASEAGLDFNPAVIEEGNGIGFGLCQWSYDRRTSIENFAASQGRDPADITLQLDFLWLELTGENPSVNIAITYPHTLQEYMEINDLYGAADWFCRYFERPTFNNVDERYANAQGYLNAFQGKSGSSSGSSSDSSSSSGTSGNSSNNTTDDNNSDSVIDNVVDSVLNTTSKAKKNVNFPYAIIKNGYHEITVNRYDVQKYTLNTKYKDYTNYTRKSEAVVKETTETTLNDKGEEIGSSTNIVVVSCEPSVTVSQTPVNTRQNASGSVDPTKEELVGSSTSTNTKYYIQKALTFDMVYRNEFVYTKYNDADIQSRSNPQTENVVNRIPFSESLNTGEKFDAAALVSSGSVANIKNSFGASATQTNVTTSNSENVKTVVRTYKIDGAQYTENEGEEIYVKREWEDKLTQASTENKQIDYDEMLKYNENEDNDKKRDTISKEDFEGAPKKEYRKYKVMSKKGNLNLIDFINANPKIYKNYLNKGMEASKYMGYIKEDDLLMSYDQLKKLINKTRGNSGTVPYAYFVSLGFKMGYSNSNSIENSSSNGSGFGWPVDLNGNDDARIINCIFPYTAGYGSSHGAIDIAPGEGSNTIIAAKDGKVVNVQDTASSGGYGNSVVIEHSDGYYTRYSHLASINNTIVEGIEVKKGQALGIMGTTGNSTGVHLDFTIYKDGLSQSNRIDPLDFYVTEPEYGSIDPSTITTLPSGYKYKGEKSAPGKDYPIIFVGDSRTVGMKQAVGDGSTYIAEVGQGLSWFSSTAKSQLEKTLDSNPNYNVVFAMGVNDCGGGNGSADQYVALYKELKNKYPDTGFYFESVNPVIDGKSNAKQSVVQAFNDTLKASFSDTYIDTFTYLTQNGFNSPDGLHYDTETYKKIYDYIINQIKT